MSEELNTYEQDKIAKARKHLANNEVLFPDEVMLLLKDMYKRGYEIGKMHGYLTGSFGG